MSRWNDYRGLSSIGVTIAAGVVSLGAFAFVPVAESGAQSTAQSTTQSVAQPAAQPVAQPVAQPIAEQVAQSSALASLLRGENPWPRPEPPAAPRTGAQFATCPRRQILQTAPNPYREFYFSRGAYSSNPFDRRGGGNSWATDFEKADRQFLVVLERLMNIDAFPCENVVYLDDPHMRQFPWVYMVEVGHMGLTLPEVEGLRSYLLQGGFIFVDDFWGTREWNAFENEITRVLPEYPIVELPQDHLIFRIVYPINEVLQVPNVGAGRLGPAFYYEQDGRVPHLRGIFDEKGRLLVLISWNSDLGDAWEWAEQPDYPWDRSNYAFQLGFNAIVYAMTH
ncbi:MAG: DUF4159 domain-containing protein [Gemmatimonadetes bacterium]|nr:DUF4159 domain-containing protein [Gemmatimonadota bacterium]